jgi:hypothetical protein
MVALVYVTSASRLARGWFDYNTDDDTKKPPAIDFAEKNRVELDTTNHQSGGDSSKETVSMEQLFALPIGTRLIIKDADNMAPIDSSRHNGEIPTFHPPCARSRTIPKKLVETARLPSIGSSNF